MTTPTIRDYVGTLGVNASVLASDIQDLLDHPQNSWVISTLSVSGVLSLEEDIVAMMDRIKAIRGDFARMSERETAFYPCCPHCEDYKYECGAPHYDPCKEMEKYAGIIRCQYPRG